MSLWQAGEPLLSNTHVEILGTILIPFIIFWLDQRRQSERHHKEWMDEQQTHHAENITRLTKIETTLDPIADWWNTARAEDRNGRKVI